AENSGDMVWRFTKNNETKTVLFSEVQKYCEGKKIDVQTLTNYFDNPNLKNSLISNFENLERLNALEKIRNTDPFIDRFLNNYDNLFHYLDDLDNSADLVTFINSKGVRGVKAWEKLLHNSIPQTVRTNTTYLSAVSKQIGNYGDDVVFQFERT